MCTSYFDLGIWKFWGEISQWNHFFHIHNYLSATPPKLSIISLWHNVGFVILMWGYAVFHILGMFYISNGKQLNLHGVSFDNVDGAFVSFETFLVFGLTSLLNIWVHIATVPAWRSGTLTNVLPHRNATLQTQDMAPNSITKYRPGADLSLCYPLMWKVTLEYTNINFVCLGLTSPLNIWGYIATVPACRCGTLANALPHRYVMPQTQLPILMCWVRPDREIFPRPSTHVHTSDLSIRC